MLDQVLERIRKESECCDSMQGFQYTHSIGGGVGSGFTTLFMDNLRDWYPGRMVCNFSVIPSQLVTDTVMEPYNTILSLHHLVRNSDLVLCFDNEAIYKPNNSYSEMNQTIVGAMKTITSPFRYKSTINNDLRKLSFNLVPFLRMHFCLSSFASSVN